tara:strand:- start:685 stop:6828 length:6144 start_codon:yes stop_codon:yes gene_type:complete
MSSYDNYIEEYVMSLPGVEQRRTFNSVGESGNTSTYGNRTTAVDSINKNKAKDKNSDRIKEIHRKSIRDRDTSTTAGQIWVEMDQDDERMNRYLFTDRTNNLDGESNIRDLTTAMNGSSENKVKDLIELLTTKTIAPSGTKWTLYGTDKPLYGYEIESIDLTTIGATPVVGSIIAQINSSVGADNYDDATKRSFTGITLPATIPKAFPWTDGIDANREIGLSSNKLNIYSYVKITTDNTSTSNTYDYYYIPTEANNTTDVAEDSANFIYYHQLYPRYHIVDSIVNNMTHSNAYQYEANSTTGAIDTTKLGKKYLLNVGESTTSDIPTTFDGTNAITFEYGDYYKVGRTVWMVSRSADEHNKYLKDHQTKVRSIRLNAIKTKDSLQTKPGQIWVKMNKNDPRNSKYFYNEITPIKWTDTGSTVRPTVGRDLSNVLPENGPAEIRRYINAGAFSSTDYNNNSTELTENFKFNYDDYILNSTGGNYWVINYDESRKLAGDTVSTDVANFFKDNTIINDGSVDTSYILNSKTDFNTQNILMDSKLVKQYGDTYVLFDNTDIPNNIKYGDYYDENLSTLFGYKWILTNQTKKLDYGRELYDCDLTQMLRDQIADIASLPTDIDITTPLRTSLVFTQSDLDNLNIKSLDYIYVANNGTEDIYYKATENSGVFDGNKWKLIAKGDTPNFGRELYHQNLSDLLTGPTDDIVTLTSTQYNNNNLSKLNLQTSDYILGADNSTAYRPMPIYIWLAVRSTENQHVYDKHHQITINDTKNEALNIKQSSDVPGQIWKKMNKDDSKNSGLYYPIITPLHWETTNNGATRPVTGRDLSEILTTSQLAELVAYVHTGTYNLDTFNANTEIKDFEFYYDDYVLNTSLATNKYYTIDYEESRKLSDARLNNHTSKTSDELKNFLLDNNFEGYKENYNYPFDKYYANIINSTRDSKTNRIIVYGDEYVLLDHRDVPNRVMDSNSLPVVKDNNIKYGDFYLSGNDIWLAVRSNDVQYAFNNTVDTDIKEIRNTAKDVRRTSDKDSEGQIWIKMLENDKRINKFHFKDMLDDANRKVTITADNDLDKFLRNNIPIKDGQSLQKSYIVDSVIDGKTNRIKKYGNEYVIFDKTLVPNQANLEFGQYYLPDDFTFGTKWSLIGTEKPTSGRLLVLDDITHNGTNPLNGTNNTVTIDTTATHETINGIAITIQNRLDELELTPDDYIAGANSTFYKAIPPYRWLVSRSDDEEYHYKKVRDIKLKDVLHEAQQIRQSSTKIGQIWVLMDSTDERISLTKFPNRRKLTKSITNITTFENLLDTFETNVSVSGFQEEFKVDDREYTKNTYSVVDSVIDKNTYEIIYTDNVTNRTGLGNTLVLLDTRDIPSLHADDIDEDGSTLRYGDYYEKSNGQFVVSMRSHDVQHAKDDADTAILDAERAAHKLNEQSALQNDYQFSVIDDRIGRLWQEVTDLPILPSNRKLIEHNSTEILLDGGTIELSRNELNTLLSDFTFTKILSTKYIQHRTTNGIFYVTSDNGTTWQQVSTQPIVGTQVYHDATSALLEANDLDLTPTQLNALTTAIDSDFVVDGSDNHNDWHEHNKRNRYYTTQYLTDGTDYFISNDFGYNWVEVTLGDITNTGTGNTNMGYEIVHPPTLTILTGGRLLLTSSELDALLNMSKYADNANSIGESDHAIIQSDGASLAGEYVSHRLLTRYHYIKSGSKLYIPGKFINEDYKNYISFPGKGKLGRYWKLREITDFTTGFTKITGTTVVNGVDADAKLANFTKFINILEGNDGSYDSNGNLVTPDPERDSNLEPRLVLTQAERDDIFGSGTTIIGTTETGTHYVQHRVNTVSNIPDVHYISQDNGITWQKLTQVSDVSVVMSNTTKIFNGINETLGKKIKDKSVANSTDGILNLDFEDFVNYEVESNVRENSYIVEGIYVYVPGQYVNEEYVYYPSAHEYPSKNDLGRIWMNIGTTDPATIDANASAINPSNSGLETLLSSFTSANNNITTVTIGATAYEIFSISYQEYTNNNVNNISELNFVLTGGNYYIPGRYINEYNDYYPLAPSS